MPGGSEPPRPGLVAPLLVATPGLLWGMANVGFWTIGVLDTDEVGYRAWHSGFSGFPRWMQALVAYVGVPAWAMAVVAAGAVVAVHGHRVWPRLVALVAAAAAVAVVVVLVGTWAHPGTG